MLVLGIETSCDECAAAVVEDGRIIRSNVVATQIPFHAQWGGVVPEIASRKHTEWIRGTVRQALQDAGISAQDIDAAAATSEPGLLGSLLVGLSFARAFAWTRGIPFVPVNHLHAHLYAPHLAVNGGKDAPLTYPYIGLLVSGGHSQICRVDSFDKITVLGTSLDDAAGEAFDKVGKYFGLPYPAGKYVDEMAKKGDAAAFAFPMPTLKNAAPCDMSYSGLKNAVINQRETFRKKPAAETETAETANIIASFQKTALDILLRSLFRAVRQTGITTIAAGGGVAANSSLRVRLAEETSIRAIFPPQELCGDNGAMVAGLAYKLLMTGAEKR